SWNRRTAQRFSCNRQRGLLSLLCLSKALHTTRRTLIRFITCRSPNPALSNSSPVLALLVERTDVLCSPSLQCHHPQDSGFHHGRGSSLDGASKMLIIPISQKETHSLEYISGLLLPELDRSGNC
ncbi:hypothetical protein TPAR_03252, partial [Tolypocladium paradoxum]